LAIPIILILAVLWVAFFTWPLVQRRLAGGGRGSLGSLSHRANPLGQFGRRSAAPVVSPIASRSIPASPFAASKPAPAGLPMSPMAQKRRRDAFMVLGVAVIAFALLAVVTANLIVIGLSVVASIAFVAYVVALVQIRRRSEERAAKVHYLPQPVHTRSLVLHRSASSSSM
jgi:type IV secretory pathway VirB3-like protein